MCTVHTHTFTTTARALAVKNKETLPWTRTETAPESITLNETSLTKTRVVQADLFYKTEQTGVSGRVWEKRVTVIKGPNSQAQSALGTPRAALQKCRRPGTRRTVGRGACTTLAQALLLRGR